MAARSTKTSVVIVGAGVVGAALAYESARKGLRVTVLERAARPAQGGTRWSMGGASWLTWAGEPRLRELCREGLNRYTEILQTDSTNLAALEVYDLLKKRDDQKKEWRALDSLARRRKQLFDIQTIPLEINE